jgi:hypothetical protein
MKGHSMKSLVFGILLLSTTVAFSQQEGYLELFRRDLKTDKVALITAAMSLSDSASNKFWPIYREYDRELTKLGDNTINNIKDYAANYESMSDKKADELMGKVFKNRAARLDLLKKYHKQVGKALGGRVAARFIQAEMEILTLIDAQIMDALPLVKGKK